MGSHAGNGFVFIDVWNYDKVENESIKIHISFQALFFMNVHAHLYSEEIIGFLSGHTTKIKGKKYLFIEDSNVVKPVEGDIHTERHKQVEMDAVDAQRVGELIEDRKAKILGWYHSHPTFIVNPSAIDINNHASLQK